MLNHSVQSLLISIYYHVLKSHNNKNNLNNENKKKKTIRNYSRNICEEK